MGTSYRLFLVLQLAQHRSHHLSLPVHSLAATLALGGCDEPTLDLQQQLETVGDVLPSQLTPSLDVRKHTEHGQEAKGDAAGGAKRGRDLHCQEDRQPSIRRRRQRMALQSSGALLFHLSPSSRANPTRSQWAGYGKDADTEEPVESFIDTELLIEYIARSAKLVEAFKDSDLVRPAKKAKRKGATNGHAPAPLFKQESPEPAKTVIKRSGSSEDEPLIHKRREMQMPKLEEEEPSLEPALPLRPIPRKASEAPAPPVKKQRVKPKPARSVSFETTACAFALPFSATVLICEQPRHQL